MPRLIPTESRSRRRRRAGTILVIVAMTLGVLVGMVGVVLDAGQLMSAHRQCQNAADAGATAAAMEMLLGQSNGAAAAAATTFVQQYNGLGSATVAVNIPPATGPHAGSQNYAEVVVDYVVPTRLIQVLGGPTSRTVTARAVAGWEGVNIDSVIIAMDANARPGIGLNGNGSLQVNGTVVVNSNGGGLTENGQPINNGNSGYAINATGNGNLKALDVKSVGGVNDPSMITNYDGSTQSPLHTGAATQSDPFEFLAPPTTGNGAVATNYGAVKLSGNQSVTLSPGVYNSISASANSTVTLEPGIYVIQGGGISLSGNGTVSGTGVMIYNTGSDYNVNTGLPDSADGSSLPPAGGNPAFGALSITGNGSLNLTSYANSASPYDGLLFYQRRLNTQPIDLSGNASVDSMQGTVYAKYALINLSGNGTMNTQFAVDSVIFTGNGTLTIDDANQRVADSDQVFLVE
ncbi:MAG TPA: pilus assembly protein TadG-related protein [Pirellulales bacterium]|nr:pilus assembly protein TadG-related protein [Pirellulales bacterium]